MLEVTEVVQPVRVRLVCECGYEMTLAETSETQYWYVCPNCSRSVTKETKYPFIRYESGYPQFTRASGDCVCRCGRKYYDHPHYQRELSDQNLPYLRVLCGGSLVKL